MTPKCEHFALGGGSLHRCANRREEPNHQIGGFLQTCALRLIKGLALVVYGCIGSLSRWRQQRTARHALQALSDHYLQDIGLDRSQIDSRIEKSIKTGAQSR